MSVTDEDKVQRAVEAWVRKHGTPNQKARQREGLLPVDEILSAVRADLFEPALDAGFKKFTSFKAKRVCARHEDKVQFTVTDARTGMRLDPAQFDRLMALRGHMSKKATVLPRRHAAQCAVCAASAKATTALVTVDWHGRPLSREFSLEET